MRGSRFQLSYIEKYIFSISRDLPFFDGEFYILTRVVSVVSLVFSGVINVFA